MAAIVNKPEKRLKRKRSQRVVSVVADPAPTAEIAQNDGEDEQPKTRKKPRKPKVPKDPSHMTATQAINDTNASKKSAAKATKDAGNASEATHTKVAETVPDTEAVEGGGRRKRKRRRKGSDAAGLVEAVKSTGEEKPLVVEGGGVVVEERKKRKHKHKARQAPALQAPATQKAQEPHVEGSSSKVDVEESSKKADIEENSEKEDVPEKKKKRKKARAQLQSEDAATNTLPSIDEVVTKPGLPAVDQPTKSLKSSMKETPKEKEETLKETSKEASKEVPKEAPKNDAPEPAKQQTAAPKKGKKIAKPKSPSPAPEPPVPNDDEQEREVPEAADEKVGDENGEEDEEDVHLYGFSTDENDSSDDDMEEEWTGLDASKLPTVAKDDAVVKKKLEQAKRQPTGDRGVIYLGRIPHGFYEDQMRAYFSQFGTVTRLRLSRNKKCVCIKYMPQLDIDIASNLQTGRSKHYAFIEFDSSSVAKIVAETMDNYLLMGHIMTCKVITKDEVHPELWIGANRKWRAVPRDRIARVQHNKRRTEEEQEKVEKRLLRRQAQKKRKLEEAGIKYDFDAVAYKKKKTKSAEA